MSDIKKVYDIVGYAEVTDVDGKKWLETLTECGTTIAVANLTPDHYEVHVRGPNEDRHYSGGEGSDAHKTYNTFYGGFKESKEDKGPVVASAPVTSPKWSKGFPKS